MALETNEKYCRPVAPAGNEEAPRFGRRRGGCC